MPPKRITFAGFMMDAAEAGQKDSEGRFTVAAGKSREKLKEQFGGDPLLAYTELLQGFRELGAREVRITPAPPKRIEIAALFAGEGPDLSGMLADPLDILGAREALHSGSGLLLLEHGDDQVCWERRAERESQAWRFDPTAAAFAPDSRPVPRLGRALEPARGTVVWSLCLRARGRLALYPKDRLQRWRRTPVAQEFVDRMAFYGVPTLCADELMQTPIPGRLVPHDYFQQHKGGPVGYSWEPLAYELRAGAPEDGMTFLSEPFAGEIAQVVSVAGRLSPGYASGSLPVYVSFKGADRPRTRCQVPFRTRWLFGSQALATPGFQSFDRELINPRRDGGVLRAHCRGRPLYLSSLTMLSTALGGPSTVVFLKNGAVLGGRHEDLGVSGALCVVGTEGLGTDLSRRNIRRDQAYHTMIQDLRRRCLLFAAETAEHLPTGHWAVKPLQAQVRAARK